MRMTASAPAAVVGGVFGGHSADVSKKNVKVFQVLSSTLYSDKIGSIIRELSCNAWDAHKMLGKENVPFEVRLPNDFSPSWSVRDFGPGLSHEDVLRIYIQYFESTKDDSNDMIGGFGLGSKSPYAYGDSYTVTSYFEGTKRVYSMTFDRRTEPTCRWLQDEGGNPLWEPTDEPNGLEVSVPVRREDFMTWASKSADFFARFDVPPKVTGNGAYKKPGREIVAQGNGWRILASDDVSLIPSVIVGIVSYPIPDWSKYATAAGLDTPAIRAFANVGLELDAPIGAVAVTPSRESLSMDEETIAYIGKRLRDFSQEYMQQLLHSVEKQPTAYMAAKTLTELAGGFQDWSFRNYLLKSCTWKGKQVHGNDFAVARSENYYGVTFHIATPSDTGRGKPSLGAMTPYMAACGDHIVSGRYKLIWNDTGSTRGLAGRLKMYDKSKGYYVVTTDDEHTWRCVWRDLGQPPFEVASKVLPELPKLQRQNGGTTIAPLMVWNGRGFDIPAVPVNLDQGGVFVFLDRGSVVSRNDKGEITKVWGSGSAEVPAFLDMARRHSIIPLLPPMGSPTQLYGVPGTYKTAFLGYKGPGKWTHLCEVVHAKVSQAYTNVRASYAAARREEATHREIKSVFHPISLFLDQIRYGHLKLQHPALIYAASITKPTANTPTLLERETIKDAQRLRITKSEDEAADESKVKAAQDLYNKLMKDVPPLEFVVEYLGGSLSYNQHRREAAVKLINDYAEKCKAAGIVW